MKDEQFVTVDQAADNFAAAGDMNAQAPDFQKVETYTTFKAEYAVVDTCDLVFHFFPNAEVQALANAEEYWRKVFPQALQKVATSFFVAEYPRLKAAYAEELASWWLRAHGYDHILDLHEFASRFLEMLDAELDPKMRPS